MCMGDTPQYYCLATTHIIKLSYNLATHQYTHIYTHAHTPTHTHTYTHTHISTPHQTRPE